MTREAFQVLEYLETNKVCFVSKTELIEQINVHKGKIGDVLQSLEVEQAIYEDSNANIVITEYGRKALEPYRVKRAIFIAAGRGERLRPYTDSCPKPLVKVGGKTMIETLLEAIYTAEIEEVIIVRGYMKEKLESLLEQYPNIQFVDNDMYREVNNISSAYLVREKLRNAYVLEADLVLFNKTLITKYQYTSNYLGEYRAFTDDWRFEVKDGKITQALVGGSNCYHMYGISYWTEEEGIQLAKDLEHAMEQEGAYKRYWDEVALNLYPRSVEIRPIQKGDIIEIDTAAELEAINEKVHC